MLMRPCCGLEPHVLVTDMPTHVELCPITEEKNVQETFFVSPPFANILAKFVALVLFWPDFEPEESALCMETVQVAMNDPR